MADIADLGNDRAQEILDDSLAALRRKAFASGPAASGQCLYCDAQVSPGMRWCDHECRDEWEKEQAVRRRAPVL